MSRKNSLKKTPCAVIPVRMPESMQKQIRSISHKAGLSDADIMRLSIDRGIGVVERMFTHPEPKAA